MIETSQRRVVMLVRVALFYASKIIEQAKALPGFSMNGNRKIQIRSRHLPAQVLFPISREELAPQLEVACRRDPRDCLPVLQSVPHLVL